LCTNDRPAAPANSSQTTVVFHNNVSYETASYQVLGPFPLREINKLACLVIGSFAVSYETASKIYSRISFFPMSVPDLRFETN
jgi:hypothetical protein